MDKELQQEIDSMTRGHKIIEHPSMKLLDLGILWWARYHMNFWNRVRVAIGFVFKKDDL